MSIIFLLLLSAIINAQNISEIVEPKCDGETIKYSIYANLSEYLENVENIDGRELYESLDDLSSKKVGTLKGLYFNRDNFENIVEYDSYDGLIEDLRNYELDAIILPLIFIFMKILSRNNLCKSFCVKVFNSLYISIIF